MSRAAAVRRNFLRLSDRTELEYRALFDRSREFKERRRRGLSENTLEGRTLALIFEKPSTRTRLSFEAAMFQLGGNAIALEAATSQLARGETLADTARVVSGYADAIMLRTFGDDRLEEFARAATVPVINGLSDGGHPVQLLADLFTIEEHLQTVKGKTVAFVGDGGSNMAHSWVEATQYFHFSLKVGSPKAYWPRDPKCLNTPNVQFTEDPIAAVKQVDVISTDVWTSMGQEAEAKKRKSELAPFSVNDSLLGLAKKDCIVLHCLPAHRGEEITDSVLDGKHSVVFDEAENRLHVQKALLEQLLLPSGRSA